MKKKEKFIIVSESNLAINNLQLEIFKSEFRDYLEKKYKELGKALYHSHYTTIGKKKLLVSFLRWEAGELDRIFSVELITKEKDFLLFSVFERRES